MRNDEFGKLLVHTKIPVLLCGATNKIIPSMENNSKHKNMKQNLDVDLRLITSFDCAISLLLTFSLSERF